MIEAFPVASAHLFRTRWPRWPEAMYISSRVPPIASKLTALFRRSFGRFFIDFAMPPLLLQFPPFVSKGSKRPKWTEVDQGKVSGQPFRERQTLDCRVLVLLASGSLGLEIQANIDLPVRWDEQGGHARSPQNSRADGALQKLSYRRKFTKE